MMKRTRIDLMDSMGSALAKMSDGNPGAEMTLIELMKASPEIDPQSALGGITPVLSLDTHGIYGSDIYVLFSDKCQRDCRKMLVLLRAVQLGILPESRLVELSKDQRREVEMTDEEFLKIDNLVCGQLDKFKKAA